MSGLTDAGRFTERGSTLEEGGAQYTESAVGAKGRLVIADELLRCRQGYVELSRVDRDSVQWQACCYRMPVVFA